VQQYRLTALRRGPRALRRRRLGVSGGSAMGGAGRAALIRSLEQPRLQELRDRLLAAEVRNVFVPAGKPATAIRGAGT